MSAKRFAAGLAISDKYRVRETAGDDARLVDVEDGKHQPHTLFIADWYRGNSTTARECLAHALRLARPIHETIARALDAGIDADRCIFWVAHEPLAGDSLENRLRAAAVTMADAGAILVQIASGLAAAHAVDITHGDLRASTVLVSRGAVAPVVRLLDFGLTDLCARADSDPEADLPEPGPGLAPEQLQGQGRATARSDVWALGLLAFELFTLQPYFPDAENLAERMRRLMFGELPSASTRARTLGARALPDAFENWFSRCVARSPADRFVDAGEAYRSLLSW